MSAPRVGIIGIGQSAFKARRDRTTALIGFDDFDTADVLEVTVVGYDAEELGRRAAQVALARVADPTGTPQDVVLPTWLVERGSGERVPAALIGAGR